jgi:chaperonin GroES
MTDLKVAAFPDDGPLVPHPLTLENLPIPLGDFVLIEPIDQTVSDGGIRLPEGADMGPNRGRVLAVGPGRWEFGALIEPKVEKGDLVLLLFAYDRPAEIPHNGQKLIIIRERAIIAKLNPRSL